MGGGEQMSKANGRSRYRAKRCIQCKALFVTWVEPRASACPNIRASVFYLSAKRRRLNLECATRLRRVTQLQRVLRTRSKNGKEAGNTIRRLGLIQDPSFGRARPGPGGHRNVPARRGQGRHRPAHRRRLLL